MLSLTSLNSDYFFSLSLSLFFFLFLMWPFKLAILQLAACQSMWHKTKKIDRCFCSVQFKQQLQSFFDFYLDCIHNGSFGKSNENIQCWTIMMECRRVSHRCAYTSRTLYQTNFGKLWVATRMLSEEREKKRRKKRKNHS